MNRKISFFTLFCAFALCFIPHDSFSYVDKDSALLRIMDKAAGKTQVVPVKVGEIFNRDGLKIIVRDCKQTDPFDAENFFAFLEIYTKSDDRIFSGWMDRNEPGKNPLQNDAWDVWLDKCE